MFIQAMARTYPPFLDIAYRRRYDWLNFHNKNVLKRTVHLNMNLPNVLNVEVGKSGKMG
jgi:hypothetical protein